jgi:hypothetical protein
MGTTSSLSAAAFVPLAIPSSAPNPAYVANYSCAAAATSPAAPARPPMPSPMHWTPHRPSPWRSGSTRPAKTKKLLAGPDLSTPPCPDRTCRPLANLANLPAIAARRYLGPREAPDDLINVDCLPGAPHLSLDRPRQGAASWIKPRPSVATVLIAANTSPLLSKLPRSRLVYSLPGSLSGSVPISSVPVLMAQQALAPAPAAKKT